MFCLPLSFLKHFYLHPHLLFLEPLLCWWVPSRLPSPLPHSFSKSSSAQECTENLSSGLAADMLITWLVSMWFLQGTWWDGLPPALLFLLARTEDLAKEYLKIHFGFTLEKAQQCPNPISPDISNKAFFYFQAFWFRLTLHLKIFWSLVIIKSSRKHFYPVPSCLFLTSKISDKQNYSFMFIELSANWQLLCPHAPLPGGSVSTCSSYLYQTHFCWEVLIHSLAQQSFFHC